MELDWKGVIEKTIVAVIAGVILSCLAWLYSVSTSEKAKKTVTVEAEWIDFTNLAYGLDIKTAQNLDKVVGDNFGPTNFVSFMRRLGIRSIARIVVLTVQNSGDTRTKDIDISTKEGAVFSYKMTESATSIVPRVHLRPLDPKETAIVYVVLPQWQFYESMPITVLNDGKLVELEMRTLGVKEWEMFRSLNENTGWVAVGVFLAIIGAMTLLVTLISAVAYTMFKKQMLISTAKSMKPKALRYWLDLIDHVRANAPERLTEAESLPSLLK